MSSSPLAGQPASAMIRVNVPHLGTAYYAQPPQPSVPQERVQFGTSGHRGSVGKTMVSSRIIFRVAAKLGRTVHEVPVGFKWFLDGLLDATLVFAGGTGENAPLIRKRICDGLGLLGIERNQKRNAQNALLISPTPVASRCGSSTPTRNS
jgi:hypothetical protein